jgi:uncharacterized protein (DUF1810 family)
MGPPTRKDSDPEDAFGLGRFIEAQGRSYETALSELRAGEKRSHWIWYVFPQLRGLGHSDNAQYYGITSLDEARAYLADPILGKRLHECVDALLKLKDTSAETVLGHVAAARGDTARALAWHRDSYARDRADDTSANWIHAIHAARGHRTAGLRTDAGTRKKDEWQR